MHEVQAAASKNQGVCLLPSASPRKQSLGQEVSQSFRTSEVGVTHTLTFPQWLAVEDSALYSLKLLRKWKVLETLSVVTQGSKPNSISTQLSAHETSPPPPPPPSPRPASGPGVWAR